MRRVEQIQVVPPVCVGAMSRDPGMTPISLRSRRRDAMRRSTKLLLCVRCGRARPPPCFCRGRSGEGVAPPVLKSVIRSYKSGDLQRFRSGVVRSDGVRSANLGTRPGPELSEWAAITALWRRTPHWWEVGRHRPGASRPERKIGPRVPARSFPCVTAIAPPLHSLAWIPTSAIDAGRRVTRAADVRLRRRR
jgi:hypothetical protein